MSRDFLTLTKRKYDLLVVGGGINGAAIANLASRVGATVALLEKNDFASGTSSKSTKLLHGGIRYLENFEFDLVAESLKERYIQWKSVPHLVKPLRFIVPVYEKQGRPLWMMKLGVWLYDLLSGKYSLGAHAQLSVQQLLTTVPGIKQAALSGAVSYFDAQMDDARLCLENVLMARVQGAEVFNHAEVVEFLKENGSATGVRVRDALTGKTVEAFGKKIIVTAGPWSDMLRKKDMPKSVPELRPTKGVHLVCRGNLGADAFLLQNKNDNRIFFIIPFKGHILIGTTDTDYSGPADNVQVLPQDVQYLLGQTKEYFPSLNITASDIITSFAGLRPLVHEPGTPSKVSRKHVIERSLSGIYYVMGGKYTTYRAIAHECLAKAMPELGRRLPKEETYAVYGSGLQTEDVKALVLSHQIPAQTIAYLMSVYGSRYKDVLKLTVQDASLKAPLCSCSPAIRAQVVYAVKSELGVTFEDVYERRLELIYNDCPTKQCRATIEAMLKAGI